MKIFFFLSCTIIIGFDIVLNRLFFTEKFVSDLKENLDEGYTMRAAFQNACNKHRIPEWVRTEQAIMKLKKEFTKSYPFS